jgi:hypothetical protein
MDETPQELIDIVHEYLNLYSEMAEQLYSLSHRGLLWKTMMLHIMANNLQPEWVRQGLMEGPTPTCWEDFFGPYRKVNPDVEEERRLVFAVARAMKDAKQVVNSTNFFHNLSDNIRKATRRVIKPGTAKNRYYEDKSRYLRAVTVHPPSRKGGSSPTMIARLCIWPCAFRWRRS